MLVAVLRVDLRIRSSRSLKQKRHVVKALTAALHQRFDLSVAEVDHQDLWQRAELGAVVVGNQEYHLRKVLHEAQKLVERWDEVELITADITVMDPDD